MRETQDFMFIQEIIAWEAVDSKDLSGVKHVRLDMTAHDKERLWNTGKILIELFIIHYLLSIIIIVIYIKTYCLYSEISHEFLLHWTLTVGSGLEVSHYTDHMDTAQNVNANAARKLAFHGTLPLDPGGFRQIFRRRDGSWGVLMSTHFLGLEMEPQKWSFQVNIVQCSPWPPETPTLPLKTWKNRMGLQIRSVQGLPRFVSRRDPVRWVCSDCEPNAPFGGSKKHFLRHTLW